MESDHDRSKLFSILDCYLDATRDKTMTWYPRGSASGAFMSRHYTLRTSDLKIVMVGCTHSEAAAYAKTYADDWAQTIGVWDTLVCPDVPDRLCYKVAPSYEVENAS